MLLPPPFPLLQVSARHHGGRGSGATIEQVTDDVAGVNSSTIGRFCLDTVPPRRCSFPTSDEPARLHDTAQQYASEKKFRDDGETNGPRTIAQRLNEGRNLACWMTGYQQATQFEYTSVPGATGRARRSTTRWRTARAAGWRCATSSRFQLRILRGIPRSSCRPPTSRGRCTTSSRCSTTTRAWARC